MSLTIQRPDGASFTFDVVTEEGFEPTVLVTENPIESGAQVTDHAQVLPLAWTAQVVATANPYSTRRRSDEFTGEARMLDVEEFVAGCLGQPLIVTTRGRSYENVLITAAPYTVDNRARRVWSISFKVARIPRLETVRLARIRRDKPGLAKKENTGPQPKPDADKAKAEQAKGAVGKSGAASLWDRVRGGS